MTDRWLVLIVTQFISAAIGFGLGLATHNSYSIIFITVGGFFFSLGAFAGTRWGFDKWRAKKKKMRLR